MDSENQRRNATVGNTLRNRIFRAGGWTVLGHVTSQALRLGANLVLTRLLFPEAFGLMAIVQAVITGIIMISDLGIEASLISNERGQEPDLINTAWTMQIVQGTAIWLVLCAVSELIASHFQQPQLSVLLPVVGLGAVLRGFTSTKRILVTRSLAIKQVVLIETGAFAAGLLVMVVWAWVNHSVWALVGGGLVSAFLSMLASHLILEGPANRLAWDSKSARELFRFGRWVLISSALTFMAGEGNKLLVGSYLGVKLLALFTLAATMNMLYSQIASQVTGKVLFPAYSEVARERPQDLRRVSARIRLFLIVPGWLMALSFVAWGDHLMWILYDERYADAGNMLRLLAVGSLLGVVGGSYDGLLWAKREGKLSIIVLGAQVLCQVVGVILGYRYLGEQGIVLGVAAGSWLLYPFQAYVQGRVGLWDPRIDLPFVLLSGVVAILYFIDSPWG